MTILSHIIILLCDILAHGTRIQEYDNALSEYQKIVDNCYEEKAQILLSIGNAHKGNEEYLEAAIYYIQSIKTTTQLNSQLPLNREDRRIYLESCYECGNSLTAINEYDESIHYYEESIKYAAPHLFPRQYIELSLGDTYRKRGHLDSTHNDYMESRRHFELEKQTNIELRGIDFKIGQSYIGEALADSYNSRQYFTEAIQHFENANNNSYSNPLLFSYWGFAIQKLNNTIENGSNHLFTKALLLQENYNKISNRTAQAYYDYAVCLAMMGLDQKSIYNLKIAHSISRYTYCWAADMNFSNFAGIFDSDLWKDIKKEIEKEINFIKSEWHLKKEQHNKTL